jgi:hypothetical protein
MNAALEAPLQGRAYAAPARASQSRARRDQAEGAGTIRCSLVEAARGAIKSAANIVPFSQVASRQSKKSAISPNASRVSGADSLKM